MPTYRRIQRVIDAQQFRVGQEPLPAGVERVAIDGRGHIRGPATEALLQYSDTGVGYAVWTRSGWALIFDGGWVVTHPHHRSVWSAEAFAREFELIPSKPVPYNP